MQWPGVVEVECFDEQIRLVCFSKHQDVRFKLVQLAARVFPEVGRQFSRDVTPKTVEIKLTDPVLEHVDHVATQLMIAVVECSAVEPVVRVCDVALSVAFVKLVMLHQRAVPGSVIGDDIDYDLASTRMSFANYTLQVVSSAVIRIDCVVIARCVWAADSPLLLFLSDGMNRHQQKDRV